MGSLLTIEWMTGYRVKDGVLTEYRVLTNYKMADKVRTDNRVEGGGPY